MKKFLTILAFIGLCTISKAHAFTETHEVASDSWTCVQVAVSSFAATQMDAPSNLLPGRFLMSVQNQCATAKLWCGPNAASISTTKGQNIAAGATQIFGMHAQKSDGTQLTAYCINDSASGNCNAEVCQFK